MRVEIPCICPPLAGGEQRHPAGDHVVLRTAFPFRDAASIRYALAEAVRDDPDLSTPEFVGIVTEFYVLGGIESWSLEDGAGKPMTTTKANIRDHLLSRPDVAFAVGDAADDLYTEAVVRPLLKTASRSSRPTRTDDSTSPKTSSSAEAPTPLKPSSTTTTRTDATEMTSPSLAGVSSS